MKRAGILLVIVGGMATGNVFGQYEPDTRMKETADSYDELYVELTNNNWLHVSGDVKIKTFSPGFSFYLFRDYPLRLKGFSFAPGIGLCTSNIKGDFHFDYKVDPAGESISTVLEKYPKEFKHIKFNYKSFDIPVEFRFRNGINGFKIALGAKAGWIFSNYYQLVDRGGKSRQYGILNINPVRYGLTARVGYKYLALNVYYGLSGVFTKKYGDPSVVPYSVGLVFTPL